jgi:hypothetical protein
MGRICSNHELGRMTVYISGLIVSCGLDTEFGLNIEFIERV